MTKQEVIRAIITRAEEKLRIAGELSAHGHYDDSVSRAYYAVFHAISALFAWKDKAFSSYAKTIGAFNKEFIHTGLFPLHFAKDVKSLFEDRQSGDYNALAMLSRETSEKHLGNARKILDAITAYLKAEGALE